ncbi:hypothetical protein [Bradyrhizobium sp.]|uniref:hypothetical protein n=1 Tax=Bradyrhizobium sp. TaxID=376 RepID=UPI003C460C24
MIASECAALGSGTESGLLIAASWRRQQATAWKGYAIARRSEQKQKTGHAAATCASIEPHELNPEALWISD